MPKMTDQQIVGAVESLIADAEGYETDELARMREDALNYYFNRDKIAPHGPGRSKQQSSDVADMIEAVVAQVLPAFEGDNVACFPPMSEDDVDQARLETDACAYVIMQQNNGHYEIQQAIRDALLLRNGVMKVYLDEKVDIETVSLQDVTDPQLAQIKLENVGKGLKDVDTGIQLVKAEETDKPGFHNVTLKYKTTDRKVCTKAVDIANFSWERDWDSIYLQECRFVAERSLPTRSELIERGYKKSVVNGLNYGGADTQVDALARNQNSARRHWQGETPAEDIIEFWECYVRMDMTGDGIASLYKVCIASSTLLEVAPIEYIPYASGTPFLQPHRFNGLGMYDKLKNVQDSKTSALRQWLDNQNNANNARVIAVDGQVNIDDVANSRPGGVVRARSPDAVVPFPYNDIGISAASTLAYLDKVRSERGGASLDMQSAEMQIAGETAHGVERQMTAKEQLAAMITRTLAETLLRQLYLLTHKALRMYVPDDLQFQVMDSFVATNPTEWPERKQVTIKAGLSMAERMRKRQALEGIIVRQDTMKQQGVYVSPDDQYNAQLDWCRVQGIDSPERYFTDPKSEEAQQAAMAQQQQHEQQMQYQQMLLDMQRNIEDRKADNEDAKVFEDARQHNSDMEFKYWEVMVKTIQQQVDQAVGAALTLRGENAQEGTGEGDTGGGPDQGTVRSIQGGAS